MTNLILPNFSMNTKALIVIKWKWKLVSKMNTKMKNLARFRKPIWHLDTAWDKQAFSDVVYKKAKVYVLEDLHLYLTSLEEWPWWKHEVKWYVNRVSQWFRRIVMLLVMVLLEVLLEQIKNLHEILTYLGILLLQPINLKKSWMDNLYKIPLNLNQ